MVRRFRAQPRREKCSAGIGQLIDMHAQSQAMFARRAENFFRVGHLEVTVFAKNIAVLRELPFRHARQHFMNDQRDILLLGIAKFLRHRMRAEKSWNELDRAFRIESSDYAQKFHLVLDRQTVTGLCFNRRRSILQEPMRVF